MLGGIKSVVAVVVHAPFWRPSSVFHADRHKYTKEVRWNITLVYTFMQSMVNE